MNEKIMVVDDDKDFLASLNKLLSSEGYRVKGFSDSLEALDGFKKEFYDVVIIDVRMPKMDGVSLLQAMREHQENEYKKSLAIIITAYADEAATLQAMKLHAVDYMMKPFENEEFLRSIRHNLDLKKQHAIPD